MKMENEEIASMNVSTMYSFVLPFEVTHNDMLSRTWMRENWHFSYYIGFVYLSLIVAGKIYMKDKEPIKVRRLLVIWNASMASFSAFATYRTLPELSHSLSVHGLHHSICRNTYVLNQVYSFWATVFTLSKAVEMIDTAFVIAKKQRLHHLHWIHHVTTMCVTFSVYENAPAMGRWMVVFNYFVHSFMYTYYALRCLNIKISRKIALLITLSQIIQMIFGLIFVIYSFLNFDNCDISKKSLILIFIMYATFFTLFINFFTHAYLIKKPRNLIKKDT